MKKVLILLLLLILNADNYFANDISSMWNINNGIKYSSAKGLTKRDVTLIREAYNFQSVLGPSVWPGWKSAKTPFLYKTREFDYLINHPNPPSEFSPFNDEAWGSSLMIRANKDTIEYQAAYDIAGINTVVISAPSEDYDPYQWVLKAVHELFHIYQGHDRVVNPFTGPYAGKHELSFPFNYKNNGLVASCRIEAELLFNLVTKNQLSEWDSTVSRRVFSSMRKVFNATFTDSLYFKYKQWMEWSEGVAKYTEQKLAELAQNSSNYQPTKEFTSLFPNSNYNKLWDEVYAGQILPIRFVGEGVTGRMMFYYSGMAKALVLDKIHPDWRTHYFKNTLDVLLTEGSDKINCN